MELLYHLRFSIPGVTRPLKSVFKYVYDIAMTFGEQSIKIGDQSDRSVADGYSAEVVYAMNGGGPTSALLCIMFLTNFPG